MLLYRDLVKRYPKYELEEELYNYNKQFLVSVLAKEYVSYSYEYNIFDLCDKPCYFGASLGLYYFNVYGSIVLYNHNKLNIIARVVYEMNEGIKGLEGLDGELKFLFKLFNLSAPNFFLLNFSITLSLRKKLEFHCHIVKENKKSNHYININLSNYLKLSGSITQILCMYKKILCAK